MSLDNVRSNSSIALEKLRQIVREHRDDVEWQLPPERELALSMGLGRRAVRRAMEVLEAEGLVWRQQGKGTFVGRRPALQPQFYGNLAERTNPSEVMEARLQMEPALARMAALRCSNEDITALERLAKKTMAASDDDGWELWDSAFHRRIAECAGNGLMLALFDVVQRIRQEPDWRQLRAMARTSARRARSHRNHEEIVAAIASRDGAAAERAMRRHLSAINADLQSIMLGGEVAEPARAPAARRTSAA
ncbi:FadR/GntR family transcriptional regulator [Chelativorans alearense]|uniref:FadR/GntR family transcriptional regulator n=1 Tax=Chelativorans alearense TaxID=2681495 RepID=UPI0013D6D611|nr:FCD domain-containing protein [Chelativorans alearense]